MTKPIGLSQNSCFWSGCTNRDKEDLILRKCSRCKMAMYCGVDCQQRDWSRHKVSCLSAKSRQTKENPLGTTQLASTYEDGVISTNSLRIKKISKWLLKEYQLTQTPEELESHLAVFLSNPIEEKKFVDILVFQKIDLIKGQLLTLVNDIYPRVGRYTNQSKNNLSDKFLNTVIPQIKQLIVDEMQVSAKFWANSPLKFREKLMDCIYSFFDTHSYSPSKGEFNSFINTQLIPQILPSLESKMDKIPFGKESKEFSERFGKALEDANNTIIVPILKSAEKC